MNDTATIETGITCNNRCVFCYQLRYRPANGMSAAARTDLDFDELVRRMEFAHEKGFENCHLTGGEPAIRRDFFKLLHAARAIGFKHVGVTTNGRMFANPKFAEKALQAGMDRVSISIQSSDPQVHDRLSGVRGAMAQTLAGIRNLLHASKLLNRRLELDTMTIIMQPNCQGLADLFSVLGKLGVRLFGIQPLITNRYNRGLLDNLYCSYEEIRAAVAKTFPVIQSFNARIRLFNIPPCLFADQLQYFEVSTKGFTIPEYRTADVLLPALNTSSRQFFKTTACEVCTLPCPGFRMEAYPQKVMLHKVLSQHGVAGEVITSLDLLTKENLDYLLDRLRQRHPGTDTPQDACPFIHFIPGEMRITTRSIADLLLKHRCPAILQCHLARPRMEDSRMLEYGNETRVLDVLQRVQGKIPVYLGIELGGLDASPPGSFRLLLQIVQTLQRHDGVMFVLGPWSGPVDKDALVKRLRAISNAMPFKPAFMVVDIGEDREGLLLAALQAVFGSELRPDRLKQVSAHDFMGT